MAYEPIFRVSPRILRLLEEIGALRERIQNATIQVPWMPILQKDARVRNTHSSTAIEGNPLTLPEVEALASGREVDKRDRANREVLNYFAGLRYIEKHASRKPLRHEDIFSLHSLVAAGVMDQGEAGRYRRIQVRVGNHMPPPPNMVSHLMWELLDWWNNRSSVWSPVVTSAILHHRFEDIHPFGDGNGRTGRMLALWELYRRGFDTHHIFSVDEVFWEKRDMYYRQLQQVRLEGSDLSGWIEYCAEGVHLTLERVGERIQKLKGSRKGKKVVLRPRQEKLLLLLRERRSLAPREIWEALGVSRQGALDLVKPLIEAGLVEHIGTRKTGKYVLKGGK